MSCPSCGGNDRTAIAPGLWECDTTRIERQLGPITYLGQQVAEYKVTCHHQYQESATVPGTPPVCTCGTFAIGQCTVCSIPVCGLHSGMLSGRRLCSAHELAAAARRNQVAAAAEASAKQEQADARHARQDAISNELSSFTDPVAALLCAVRARQDRTWDDQALARWYATQAPAPETTVRFQKSGFFGPKHGQVPAHIFRGGSQYYRPTELLNKPTRDGYAGASLVTYADIAVGVDGRIIYISNDHVGSQESPPPPDRASKDRFSVRVLVEMADRLKLPALRTAPHERPPSITW